MGRGIQSRRNDNKKSTKWKEHGALQGMKEIGVSKAGFSVELPWNCKRSLGVPLSWEKEGSFFKKFTHHAMLALAVLLSDPMAISLVALQLRLTASSRTVSRGSGHSQLFRELGEVTERHQHWVAQKGG